MVQAHRIWASRWQFDQPARFHSRVTHMVVACNALSLTSRRSQRRGAGPKDLRSLTVKWPQLQASVHFDELALFLVAS